MTKQVKLVAESLQEWEETTPNELNESAKGLLQRFVKNPEKKKAFVAAFARQIGKTKGLRDALLKLSDESKVKLANQALQALEDPKMGYPWVKIAGGKITGAGALPVKKSSVGSELGA